MKRIALLIAALAVLASGCRMDVAIRLDVADNGSGTLATEVTINNQARDLINSLAGDGEAIVSAFTLRLDGETVTNVGDETTSYTTTVAFDDPDDIEEAAAGNFSDFTLQMADEGVALEATLDIAGELDFSTFPIQPDTIDPEVLGGRIVVSLPGDVTEHNADELLDDGSLSWAIPLEEDLYIFANTVYPTDGFPWWLLGLLAVSIALAFAVWMAAVRREKKTTVGRRPAPEPPRVDGPETKEPERKPEDLKSQPRQHSPFFDFED